MLAKEDIAILYQPHGGNARPWGGDAAQFEPFTPPSMQELDALISRYKCIVFVERGSS